MKIEVGKRYKSGDKEGRVIAVDRNNSAYPVVFLQDDGDVNYFTPSGMMWHSYAENSRNLREIPKTYWINVYPTGTGVHSTKEEADKWKCSDRLARVKVKEGEFHED